MDAQRILFRRVACAASTASSAPRMALPCARLASDSSLSFSSPLIFSTATAIPSSSNVVPAGRRYKSSASRTKRALNIQPHPTFLGDASAAQATAALENSSTSSPKLTILYNPPASAPSVYQTPFKFLPKSDPRRRLNISSLFNKAPPSPPASSTDLPPEVVPSDIRETPKYHLTPEDVAEMRELRAKDPLEWSVKSLARKYNCSPIFVMLAVQSSREHRDHMKARVDSARQRWGPIRIKAKQERDKRREMLYNGEL